MYGQALSLKKCYLSDAANGGILSCSVSIIEFAEFIKTHTDHVPAYKSCPDCSAELHL